MKMIQTCFIAMSLSLALSACANYDTVERPPTQEVIDRQVQTLSAWKPGMDAASTEGVIHWYKYWDYSALETDGTWRIVEITNPETNASFGLFFHDDKLVALNSGEDVSHAFDCLQTYNLNGKHWLIQGLGGYDRWLESHSIFSDKQALAAHGTVAAYVHDQAVDRERRARGAPSTDEVASAIGYAPLLVFVGIPYLVYYEIHGKKAQDEETKEKQGLAAFQASLKLGQAAPDPDEFPPDATYDVGMTELRQYNYGSFAYGVRDGRIVMLESPAAFEEDDRLGQVGQSFGDEWKREHSHDDCAAIRGAP